MNSTTFLNAWTNIGNLPIENTLNYILTNATIESVRPDTFIFDLISDGSTHPQVLDFGCGIGRNTFGLSLYKPNLTIFGYDNFAMINKTNEYATRKYNRSASSFENVTFLSDWNIIKQMKFDCIFAAVVLQHITEKELYTYLSDFKNMTKKLIVSGRRFNDDQTFYGYKNTWEILEKNGYIPSKSLSPYSVDGDMDEHMTCIYEKF